MRYIFSLLIVITSMPLAVFCQTEPASTKGAQIMAAEKCAENPDALYNRRETLEDLAEILNNTATRFYNAKYLIKREINIATVENEKPIGFFVYDLTDDSNVGTPLGKCIEFKNRHVYHFSLIFTPYSFSHLVVLEEGKRKVFKAINCEQGDGVGDVLNYLSQRMKNNEEKKVIISRVENYRGYGIYAATDDHALKCIEVGGGKKCRAWYKTKHRHKNSMNRTRN